MMMSEAELLGDAKAGDVSGEVVQLGVRPQVLAIQLHFLGRNQSRKVVYGSGVSWIKAS
jgi:hypothetical protein